MQSTTAIFLQATPDFGIFWFALGPSKAIHIELHFAHRQDDVYNLSIERWQANELSEPLSISTEDIDMFLHSVGYATELYSGKYQDRIIRCEPTDQIQETVFRIIFRQNQEKMATVFSIQEEENGKRSRPSLAKGPIFVLKRVKNIQPAAFIVEQMVSTVSHIFRTPLLIRLSEVSPYSNEG